MTLERISYRAKKSVTLLEAFNCGLIDCNTGLILDPRSGKTVTLYDAVNSQLIDCQNTSIIDPNTRNALRLDDALEAGLISKYSCTVGSRDKYSIADAIDNGLVNNTEKNELISSAAPIALPKNDKHGLSLTESYKANLIDGLTHQFLNPRTAERISLQEAILCGIVEPRRVLVDDKLHGQALPLDVAIERGLVVPQAGGVLDVGSGTVVPYGLAIENGMIIELPKPSEASVTELSMLLQSGKVTLSEENQLMLELDSGVVTLTEALANGFVTVNPRVALQYNDITVPLTQTLRNGALKTHGDCLTTAEGITVPLLQSTVVSMTAQHIVPTLVQTVVDRQYDFDSNCLVDSTTRLRYNLLDAISAGLVGHTKYLRSQSAHRRDDSIARGHRS